MDTIMCGDALTEIRNMPDESVDCIITSPPYWGLRDYGVDGQLGLEPTIERFIINMSLVTWELKRVLKKTGTMWWNHGDSYEDKNLLMQPYRLALMMVDEQQWVLRNIVVWHKPNGMPSSIEDRLGVDYEPVFFFSKSKKYHFDMDAIREPHGHDERASGFERARAYGYDGKGSYKDWYFKQRQKKDWANKKETGEHRAYGQALRGDTRQDVTLIHPLGRAKRSVWSISTAPFSEAHFATFPEKLIEPMILAGCSRGGVVLDPFMGAGTTAVVAKKFGRKYLGIELNPEYITIAEKRLANIETPLFS